MAKLKNLYNLASFADAQAHAKKMASKYNQFSDASGLVLARNLIAVDPKIYTQQFPNLTFLSGAGIGVNNTGGVANIITKLKKSVKGQFRNADDVSRDKGLISLELEEATGIPVTGRQAHSNWNDDDVQNAKVENVNLVSDLIGAHNKVYHQEIDEIGYIGLKYNDDTTLKFGGLLNNTIFATTASAKTIDTMTGDEMYGEFRELLMSQWLGVNNIEAYMANTLVTSRKVYTYLTTTFINTAGGLASVLEALQKSFKEANGTQLKIVLTHWASALVGGNDVATAFNSSEDSMVFRIPKTLEIGKIIQDGSFNFKFDSRYRVGALDIHESVSGKRLTGL